MPNKLSYTASYIAVKFYGLTLNPKIASKFDRSVLKFYQEVVAFLPKHLSWNQRSLTSQVWRDFFVWWEELLLPGDLMHIVCRKYYIQKMIERDLSKNGYEQLVILGSGFDHNGRFFSSKKIPCFEIDTHFMMDQKKKLLTKNSYDSENLHLCPIDPSNSDIKAVLEQNAHFDLNKKTLIVAEGFFDYLSLESNQEILQSLRNLGNHFKLISTFFDLSELNFFNRFMFTSGVAMVGETLKLPLNRTEFIRLLADHDIKTKNQLSYLDMKEELVENMELSIDLPVLKGFYILESELHH
jgi:O-methyltransferase involved in polyketide biosynthesis